MAILQKTGSESAGPGAGGADGMAPAARGPVRPLVWLAGLLGLELLAISLIYNHSFDFECRAMAPVVFCAALGFGVIRAIAVLGAVIVFLLSKGGAIARLAAAMRTRLSPGWLAVEMLGFVAILIPWSFMSDAASGGDLALAAGFWLGGLMLAGLGAALMLFPAAALIRAARDAGWSLLVVIAIAGFAPEIADLVQFLWHWPAIAAVTFSAVALMLQVLGQDVHMIPAEVELGIGEFIVLVGRQCSGVEGFALITSFLLLYIWLFRDQLRFPRVWILLPIGIAVSWCFNVIRIGALILVGAHISPDLAINGFHSHAGWLMFTVLSVGIAVMVHRTTWLRRETAAGTRVGAGAPVLAETPVGAAGVAKGHGTGDSTGGSMAPHVPLSADPVAAQILPFIVFMASALLAQTFSEVPALAYPARALAMAAVLWVFRGLLVRLPWRLDPLAMAAGALIGGIWLLGETAENPALDAGLAGLGAPLLMLWVVTRVIGTAVLVPVIEELFFRGYVLGRIAGAGARGPGMTMLAVAVSTVLFAVLHGRWFQAGIAGLIFALLVLRQSAAPEAAGKRTPDSQMAAFPVTDAILAHMVANAVVAAAAVITGNWALI